MGFASELLSPNKFSAARGHLSAVNSLEQELELNTLAMNCSSVIRLTHAGNFLHGLCNMCARVLAEGEGNSEKYSLSFSIWV